MKKIILVMGCVAVQAAVRPVEPQPPQQPRPVVRAAAVRPVEPQPPRPVAAARPAALAGIADMKSMRGNTTHRPAIFFGGVTLSLIVQQDVKVISQSHYPQLRTGLKTPHSGRPRRALQSHGTTTLFWDAAEETTRLIAFRAAAAAAAAAAVQAAARPVEPQPPRPAVRAAVRVVVVPDVLWTLTVILIATKIVRLTAFVILSQPVGEIGQPACASLRHPDPERSEGEGSFLNPSF